MKITLIKSPSGQLLATVRSVKVPQLDSSILIKNRRFWIRERYQMNKNTYVATAK